MVPHVMVEIVASSRPIQIFDLCRDGGRKIAQVDFLPDTHLHLHFHIALQIQREYMWAAKLAHDSIKRLSNSLTCSKGYEWS